MWLHKHTRPLAEGPSSTGQASNSWLGWPEGYVEYGPIIQGNELHGTG